MLLAALCRRSPANDTQPDDDVGDWPSFEPIIDEPEGGPPSTAVRAEPGKEEVKRVFITHGKNTKILGQIEKIVRHGGFEPVIAKNNETAAKPVPDIRSALAT